LVWLQLLSRSILSIDRYRLLFLETLVGTAAFSLQQLGLHQGLEVILEGVTGLPLSPCLLEDGAELKKLHLERRRFSEVE
jgi:hypothetical protein